MRSKQKGFTLFELLFTLVSLVIGVVFVVLLGAFAFAGYKAFTSDKSNVSVDLNGVVTTRCINHYEFVVGADGRTTQVLDEAGRAIRCYN